MQEDAAFLVSFGGNGDTIAFVSIPSLGLEDAPINVADQCDALTWKPLSQEERHMPRRHGTKLLIRHYGVNPRGEIHIVGWAVAIVRADHVPQ